MEHGSRQLAQLKADAQQALMNLKARALPKWRLTNHTGYGCYFRTASLPKGVYRDGTAQETNGWKFVPKPGLTRYYREKRDLLVQGDNSMPGTVPAADFATTRWSIALPSVEVVWLKGGSEHEHRAPTHVP